MTNVPMTSINTSLPFEGEVLTINDTNLSSDAAKTSDNVRLIKDVAMALMIGVTVTGNALVILSFVVDANLRTQSNYFLLNLAICDFCIGTFSIPLYMKNYIMNGRWILGKYICKAWLAIDYVICQCSIYNIVLISYDRFLAVTKAVSYRGQQHNIGSAVLKMMVAWTLAFLVYGPVIIFWEYVAGYSNIPEGDCNPEFFYNQYFRLWSSIIFFFTPLVGILYFNLSTYINIRNRTRTRQKSLVLNTTDSSPIFTIAYLPNCNGNKNSPSKQERKEKPASFFKRSKLFTNLNASFNRTVVLEHRVGKTPRTSPPTTHTTVLSADIKIAKSLAVLVGTFCFCWAPYSLIMIAREPLKKPSLKYCSLRYVDVKVPQGNLGMLERTCPGKNFKIGDEDYLSEVLQQTE
ncbi:histamine H3 receptor-like [Lissotriton helveticus]